MNFCKTYSIKKLSSHQLGMNPVILTLNPSLQLERKTKYKEKQI